MDQSVEWSLGEARLSFCAWQIGRQGCRRCHSRVQGFETEKRLSHPNVRWIRTLSLVSREIFTSRALQHPASSPRRRGHGEVTGCQHRDRRPPLNLSKIHIVPASMQESDNAVEHQRMCRRTSHSPGRRPPDQAPKRERARGVKEASPHPSFHHAWSAQGHRAQRL